MNFVIMQNEQRFKTHNVISYEKDLNKYRDRLGFYYGLSFHQIAYKYQTYDENYQKTYLTFNPSLFTTNQLGFLYNVPLTAIGNRISLQAEAVTYAVEYISVNTDPKKMNLNSRIISLPFSVRYILPLGFVSPSIGIGTALSYVLNFKGYDQLHRTQKEGLFFDLNLDYKISKKISLFNTFRLQSYSNLIGGEGKMANYATTLKYHKYTLAYNTNALTFMVGVKF